MGKIERFNRTIENFLVELSLQKAQTLEELNHLFKAWLSEGYNNKPHSALNGKTPAEVFASDNTPLRFHDMETLTEAFFHEAERRVDKRRVDNRRVDKRRDQRAERRVRMRKISLRSAL